MTIPAVKSAPAALPIRRRQRRLSPRSSALLAMAIPKFPAEALERKLRTSRKPLISVTRTGAILSIVDSDRIDWWNLDEGTTLKFPALPDGSLPPRKKKRKRREPPKFNYIQPAPVTKGFRERSRKCFPALDEDPAYWRFFSYLIAGDFFDRDSGQLVLSRDVVADAVRKAGDKNVKAGDFLKRFKKQVMGDRFDYRDGWVAKVQARLLEKLVLPEQLKKALEEEDFMVSSGKVNLADGKVFNTKKARLMREGLKAQAMRAIEYAKNLEAEEMLRYLNMLPHNLFTSVWKNKKQVKQAVAALDEGRGKTQIEAYVRSIMREPQPFYRPSAGVGDRIFGIGGNLTNVGAGIRAILVPEWYEADLKNSQLAILARIGEIKEVQSFLAQGENVWAELCRHMGVPPDKYTDGKMALKGCLYPTTYGMSRANLKTTVVKKFDEKGLVGDPRKFLKHWIIKALIKARMELGRRIRAKGGMETCYGRFIERRSSQEVFWSENEEEVETHQIMAIVAQALEMHLIYPAFELAKAHRKDFTITLAQHDGFSVKFHRRAEEWKKRIKKVIQERIDLWEINTTIEWKDPSAHKA